MDNRHFLLSACSYTPGAERWVESSTVMSKQFLPVLAMYQNHFAASPHCKILKIDQPWPGKVKRIVHAANLINHLGTNRWYIWSDCGDVVFQREPVALFDSLPPKIRAVVCSEGITAGKHPRISPFLKNPKFAVISENTVYNSGVFAIRGDFFLDFTKFISSIVTPLKTVPDGIDQLLFNYWIHQNNAHVLMNNSLCLNLANRFIADNSLSGDSLPDGSGQLVNGRFINRFGSEFPIVHANGNSKHLLDQWVRNK